MKFTSARSPARSRRLPEARTMITESSIMSVSGDIQVAGTPQIAAPGALYAVDSSLPRPYPGASPTLRVRDCPVGKTIDHDRRERDHHHQPLRQIHLSRREVCPKKRSHPSDLIDRAGHQCPLSQRQRKVTQLALDKAEHSRACSALPEWWAVIRSNSARISSGRPLPR